MAGTMYRLVFDSIQSYTGYCVIGQIEMKETVGGVDVLSTSLGTATASSELQAGTEAYMAINNTIASDSWHSANQGSLDPDTMWWQFEFDTFGVFIEEYTIRARPEADTQASPLGWRLQRKDKAEDKWETVDTRTGEPNWVESELRTYAVGAENAALGKTFIANNSFGDPLNVNDGDLATYVQANTYLAVDMGTPVVINRMEMANHNTTAAAEITGKFQGSNDSTDGIDGTWDDLLPSLSSLEQKTPTAWPGWVLDVEVPNTNAYKWYRFSEQSAGTANVVNEVKLWTPTNVVKPYYTVPVLSDYTVLLHGEGENDTDTIIDHGKNHRSINAIGPVHSTTEKVFGNSSIYFTGDKFYMSDASDWDLAGDGGWTIDFWIKRVGTGVRQFLFGQSDTNASYNTLGFYGEITASNTILIGYVSGSSSISAVSPEAISTEWTHVAAQRSGDNIELFLNGILVATTTGANANAANSISTSFSFGGLGGYASLTFTGYMDEIRWQNGVTSYSGNFTPPTAPYSHSVKRANDYTVLLHGEGADGTSNFIDNGENAQTLVATNVTHVTSDSKFGSSSIYFDDATHGRLKFLDTSAWDISGGGDWTLDFWVKRVDSVRQAILGQSDGGGANTSIGLFVEMNGTQVEVGYMSGATEISIFSVEALNDTDWYHVAAQRKGDDLQLFINGSLSVSTNGLNSYTPNYNSAYPMTIGGFSGMLASLSFHGYIDEFRWQNGIAAYSGDFTPETSPYADGMIEAGTVFGGNGAYTLTVDNTKVSEDLTDFPVTVRLNSTDHLSLFSALYNGEAGLYDSKMKITHDGNELPVEVSHGTLTSLTCHTKVPTVSASADTEITLSYDSTWDDNVYEFGDLCIQSDTTNGSTSITDSSLTPHSLTLNGNVQHSTAQSKIGGSSLRFVGPDDYISVGTSTNLDFGSGDFTIDFWFNADDTLENRGLFSLKQSSDDELDMFTQSGNLRMRAQCTSYVVGAVSSSTWYHIAIVREGINLYTYVNGVLAYTKNVNGLTFGDNGGGIWIGQYFSSTYTFVGYMDQFRITKGKAVWTENFTPPTTAYKMGYIGETGSKIAQTVWDDNFAGVWHMSQDPSVGGACILDSTSNTNHGTPEGSMESGNLINDDFGSALYFDGVDDLVVVPDKDILTLSSGFTISIEVESDSNTYRLIAKGSDSGERELRVKKFDSTSLEILLGNGLWTETLYPPVILPTDTVFDLTVTWDGSNYLYIYLDGVLVNTQTGVVGPLTNKTAPLDFSMTSGSGKIYNCMISNTVRSSAWISATNDDLRNTLMTIVEYKEPTVPYVITIDSSKISENLTDFPLQVKLNSTNHAAFFTELVVEDVIKPLKVKFEQSVSTYSGLFEWNPLDTDAAYNISPDGLTITKTGADAWNSARADVGWNSGKHFWTMKMEAGTATHFMVGVGTADHSLTTYPSNDGTNKGWAYYTYSTYTPTGTLTVVPVSVPIGSFLAVALDMDAGKIWFGYALSADDDITWSGDPSAGTGEAFNNLPTDGTMIYPMISMNSTGCSSILNVGPDFGTYTVPTGFGLTQGSTVITQLPAEVVSSSATEVIYYTKVPTVSASADTEITLSYDNTWNDNVYEFGDLCIQSDTTNGSTAITDSSLSNHTLTLNGNVQHSTTQSKIGGSSLYFDGTDDCITMASSSLVAFGTGDFTIDFYIYKETFGSNEYVFDIGSNGGLISIASGSIRFYNPTTGTGSALYNTGYTLQASTWYHMAAVRHNGTTTVYVDGTSIASATDAHTYLDAILGIGCHNVAQYYLTGYIDQFRITKGKAIWTENFTPPTTAYKMGYIGETGSKIAQTVWDDNFAGVWHMSQDPSVGGACILDSTSNAVHCTPYGSMSSSSLINGTALDFDGTDDYLTNSLKFSANNSVSFKINISEIPTSNSYIMHQGDTGVANEQGTAILINTLGKIIISWFNGSWSNVTSTNSVVVGENTVSLSFNDDLSSTININGEVDNLSMPSTAPLSTYSFKIGAVKSTSMQDYFDGSIDELYVSGIGRSDAWLSATNDDLRNTLTTIVEYKEPTVPYVITIDSSKISENLTDFPLQVKLNSTNHAAFFTELVVEDVIKPLKVKFEQNVPTAPLDLFVYDDGGVNYSVSPDGQTVTKTSGTSWTSIRATTGWNSGKHFWVTKIVSGSTNGIMVGVGTADHTLSHYISAAGADQGWAYYANGDYRTPTGTVGSVMGLGTGHYIAIALDMDAGKIWFGYALSAETDIVWYGDPSAGTGDVLTGIPTDGTSLYPMLTIYYENEILETDSKDFGTFTVPTGFEPAASPLEMIELPTEVVSSSATEVIYYTKVSTVSASADTEITLSYDNTWNDNVYEFGDLCIQSDTTNGSTVFTDSSVSGLTVTAYGNARHSTAKSKFGTSSMLFEGSSDYIKTASTSLFDFGTEDFTIDFWINWIDYVDSASLDYIIYWNSSNYIRTKDTGALEIKCGGSIFTATSNFMNSNDQWYHVAMVRSSGNLSAYVDGASTGTPITASNNISHGLPLIIGGDDGTYFIKAYIDQFRITKGKAVWTEDFTPPTTAYEMGYIGETGSKIAQTVWDDNFVGVWHLNSTPDDSVGGVIDSTNNGNHFTSVGMDETNIVEGVSGNGYVMNGDYLKQSYEIFDLRTMTFEFSMKSHVSNLVWGRIAAMPAVTVNTPPWSVKGKNTDNDIGFRVCDASNVAKGFQVDDVYTTGEWASLALVAEVDSLPLFYSNGVSKTVTPFSTYDTNYAVASGDISIGKRQDNDYSINADIDEIRFSNIPRSAAWLSATNDDLRNTLATIKALVPLPTIGVKIDHTKVSENLTDFPLQVKLNSIDHSEFFDEMVGSVPTGLFKWNPNDAAAGYTIAEDGVTVTKTTSSWASVRGDTGWSSGKYFWVTEIVSTPADVQMMFGVGTAAHTLDNYVGAAGNAGWSYYSSGNFYNAGATSGAVAELVQGDKLAIAVDIDAGKIWFGYILSAETDVTWWNSGDPAAGTDPIFSDLPTDGTKIYPMISLYSGTPSQVVTNNGPDFGTFTIPTGYTYYAEELIVKDLKVKFEQDVQRASPLFAWNPADFAGGWTVDGVVATHTAVGTTAGRGDTGWNSGKIFWTVEITTYTNILAAGVCDAAHNLGVQIGQNGDDGWAYQSNGCYLYPGGYTPAGSIQTLTTGDSIAIAVDLDAGKLWFGYVLAAQSDITWYGDPAAGTGAAFDTLPTDGTKIFPVVDAYGAGSVLTANPGPDFGTYTVPTGFEAPFAGITELPAEVVYSSTDEVIYYTKSPFIASSTDTEITLSFDSTWDDNVYELGDLCVQSNTTDGSTEFVDSSVNELSISVNSTAKHSTDQAKFGASSMYFTVSDAIVVTNDGTFDCGTDDFTVDYWLWKVGYANNDYHFDIGSNGTYVRNNGGQLELRAAGALRLTADAPTPSQWVHIAIVRASGTTTLYYDGVSQTSTATSYAFGSSSNLTVGNYGGLTTYSTEGYIDEFRFTKGKAVWTENFTPSTAPYKMGYVGETGSKITQTVWDDNFAGVWHMSQDPSVGGACIIDSTKNANNGTPYGMTSESLVSDIFGNSLYFDGVSAKIDFGTGVELAANGINVDMLVKFNSILGDQILLEKRKSNASTPCPLLFYNRSNGTLAYNDEGVGTKESTSILNNNEWAVLSLQRNPTSVSIFKDGVEQYNTSFTESLLDTTAVNTYIGVDNQTNSMYLDAWVGSVRISNIPRSDAWISATNDDLRNTLSTVTVNTTEDPTPPPAQVDDPVIALSSGEYLTTQTIEITCSAGATIYYTTDGTDPTSGSTEYIAPIAMFSGTLKAIAILQGANDSNIVSESYTISTVANPTMAPTSGEYGPATTITISTVTEGASIYYTTDGSTPDSGSTLYSAPVTVIAGTLKAIALKTGYIDSQVVTEAYTITPVDDPVIDTATGTYDASKMVAITCATAGASIYYTTDGSVPTSGSTLYSGPIAIMEGTLKSIAIKAGQPDSAVVEATYTVTIYIAYSNIVPTTASTVYGTTETLRVDVQVLPADQLCDVSFYSGVGDQLGPTIIGVADGDTVTVTIATVDAKEYSWYVVGTKEGEGTFQSDTYTFNNEFICSGKVQTTGPIPEGITVCLYRRDDHSLIGTASPSTEDGTFFIPTTYNGYHYAIALHPDTTVGALIYDWLIP